MAVRCVAAESYRRLEHGVTLGRDAGDAAGVVVTSGGEDRHVAVPPNVQKPIAAVVSHALCLAGGVLILDQIASRIVPERFAGRCIARRRWISFFDLAMEGIEFEFGNAKGVSL